jgi:hypothetical protein
MAVAGALAFVGLHWSNTGKTTQAPFTDEPVQTVAENPKSVDFNGEKRKEVFQVAAHFVATAVVRQHLAESWDLLAPSLQKGFTRATWARGNIPVVPYQADAIGVVRSRLDYSYSDRVGLKVAIFPRPEVKIRAQTFDMELQDLGSPGKKHWLVSYWAPAGTQGLPSEPADANGTPVTYTPPEGIGAVWLVLPIALIAGAILLLLISLAVRGWLRRARAERAARAFYNSTSSPS